MTVERSWRINPAIPAGSEFVVLARTKERLDRSEGQGEIIGALIPDTRLQVIVDAWGEYTDALIDDRMEETQTTRAEGTVLWYCGRSSVATEYSREDGDLYCKSASDYAPVRHLRKTYGCGWYEMTATKE